MQSDSNSHIMQHADRYFLIIQSEGKGHFSQALEVYRILKAAGVVEIQALIGRKPFQKLPDYFRQNYPDPLKTFISPGFIRRRNRKGILPGLSVLLNLSLVPIFLLEALRVRQIIHRSGARKILNFYEPVGAVACRRTKGGQKVISISHHFYLSHPDFFSPRGFGIQPFLLGFMNNYFIRHSDAILALSFRKGKPFRKITVVPPLISNEVRKVTRTPGGKDLAYLLADGFLLELVENYQEQTTRQIDIFLSSQSGPDARLIQGNSPTMEKNKSIRIYSPDRKLFLEKMSTCNRLICTSGFDSIAEAFYLEVPVFLIPAEGHFEQYCNALDASRTGMAFQLQAMSDLQTADIQPSGYKTYKRWADQAEDLISRQIFDDTTV